MNIPKLPTFPSDEELIDWFDNNDTAPYMAEMEPADEEFSVIFTEFPTRPVELRLHTDVLIAIETLAERRGVLYQRLMQTWLLDRPHQEAPARLPQSHP